MEVLAGLLTLLRLLPQLISLFERIAAYSKERDLESWISDLNETFDKLEKAQTIEDKRAALKALSELAQKL